MESARRIEIVEVAPRDGLQNEPMLVAAEDKIALVGRALSAGARRIEVTSFVNPARVPQMADAEAVMAGIERPPEASFIGLVLNERGFERAARAGCHEITYVIVASETFNRRNNGVSIAESNAGWRKVARAAKTAGLRTTTIIAASFGCPFEGEVPADRVLALASTLLEEEPDELAFADTIGCGVPSQVEKLLHEARRLSPTVKLRCHFHDTRNTAVANSIAAVAAGANALDGAIGGFGGCPFAPAATGNVATEDLAYALGRMGVETGLVLPHLLETAHWLSDLLGKPAPGALSRAGPFPGL